MRGGYSSDCKGEIPRLHLQRACQCFSYCLVCGHSHLFTLNLLRWLDLYNPCHYQIGTRVEAASWLGVGVGREIHQQLV